jgi:nuclear transport factor 2 (NTF2) superfamily protein
MCEQIFNEATATACVRAADEVWNRRDVEAIARAVTVDCQWRLGSDVIWRRERIRVFLTDEWRREPQFRMLRELWSWQGRRIAARYAAEFRTTGAQWFRSCGIECGDFEKGGLVHRLHGCYSVTRIAEHERLLLRGKALRLFTFPPCLSWISEEGRACRSLRLGVDRRDLRSGELTIAHDS